MMLMISPQQLDYFAVLGIARAIAAFLGSRREIDLPVAEALRILNELAALGFDPLQEERKTVALAVIACSQIPERVTPKQLAKFFHETPALEDRLFRLQVLLSDSRILPMGGIWLL